MQKLFTHYLISVCYIKKGTLEFFNLTVQKDTYPSKLEIETYITDNLKDVTSITILGISPQTLEQNRLFFGLE